MNSNEKAREVAIRKLGSMAYTEKEIRVYLQLKGFSALDVNSAVAFLKEYKYLDDEDYCRRYCVVARRKGKAQNRIMRELAQKGISPVFTKTVFQEMEAESGLGEEFCSDRDAAMEVGMKMARQQEASMKDFDQKFLARVGRRLAGLGYDSSTCYYVMNKLKDYGKDYE